MVLGTVKVKIGQKQVPVSEVGQLSMPTQQDIIIKFVSHTSVSIMMTIIVFTRLYSYSKSLWLVLMFTSLELISGSYLRLLW